MVKIKIVLILILISLSNYAFAARGYVGLNSVSEVFFVEASNYCSPNGGSCLLIFFEGGALGCNPASNWIAIRQTSASYKDAKVFALLSLTTGKKLRTYASREFCADADSINVNGASVYDVPN